MNFPKIFCLTLSNEFERIESCKQQFEKYNLSYDFFYGIDGKNSNLSVVKNSDIIFQTMTPGRIGCFLSHYMLWNHILYSPYEEVLILENDFEFNVSFDEIMNYKKEVPVDWDLFFVGYCCESTMQPVTENIFIGDGICTHAYFIKKESIKKFLNRILPVDLPIDMKLRTIYSSLNVYYSGKKCVLNKSLEKINGYKSATQS